MLKVVGVFLAAAVSIAPAWSQGAPFAEGRDYVVRSGPAYAVESKVVEYFSYSCPHCYSAEPLVKQFLKDKSDGVAFERIAVGFGRKDWEITQQAYIIKEILNLGDDVHEALFARIHNKSGPFRSMDDLQEFFESQGISKDDFQKAASSFSADTKTRTAKKRIRDGRVAEVPTFIVNARYVVTMHRYYNPQEMSALLNYLATKDQSGGE